MKRILIFLFALVCMSSGIGILVSAGLPQRADYSGYMIKNIGYVAPEIGKQAPPFSLESLSGTYIDLQDLRGSIVILNFWGTWCQPCRIEMPQLEALYQDYRNTGLRILAINLGENRKDVAQWVQELDLSYDILLDSMQLVTQIYHIRGQPSTYVILPDGTIQAIYYGPVSLNQLEATINQYKYSP